MDNSEHKRERFLRIAPNRTNKVLEDLRLLGNCSNRQNYKYERKEIEQIFKAIDQEVKRVKALFEPSKREFKL